MGVMMSLGRAGFLPPCPLKSASCLCRYSGTCAAILGLAAATLLPSAPWHATHTWPAICFRYEGECPEPGSHIDAVFSMSADKYGPTGNGGALQLTVVDFAPSA